MAKDESKAAAKVKRQASAEVSFKCQRCQRQTPLKEMRIVTRFFPLLVVCRDCEKEM
jgi:hypothetical protein